MNWLINFLIARGWIDLPDRAEMCDCCGAYRVGVEVMASSTITLSDGESFAVNFMGCPRCRALYMAVPESVVVLSEES